jgi:hypothetical protein
LDGVKYAGRVEMAAFGLNRLLFGSNKNKNENKKQKAEEITTKKPLTFQDFYNALNMNFYGMDRDIQYRYHLDMNKLLNATLSEIVIGITAFQGRPRTGNEINVIPDNPSIFIYRMQVDRVNDKIAVNTNDLIGRLNDLKEFIIVKLDNKEKEGTTRLRDIVSLKHTSGDPRTPRGRRSSGGRRTKRTKRSKRSKHTCRRKH